MKFEDKYFADFNFSKEQVRSNFENAERDLDIANKDKILEVKFNYTYSAFLKSAIALISFYKKKIKSVPGHHIKIIEKTSEILKDKSINDMGNLMRTKRNLDLYSGGIEVMQKECKEYMEFVVSVMKKIKKVIF